MKTVGGLRTKAAADRREGGFTLIEILVAVFIVGLIYSFIFGVLSTSINTSREAMKRMEVERVGRYFISRISTDIACATMLPTSGLGGLLGKHHLNNEKSRDEVHFTAFSQSFFTARPPTDQAEIGYFFLTDENGKESLMRRESDIIERPVDLGGDSYPISDMVDELTIKYKIAPQDTQWVENWDSETRRALPAVVSIELRLDDGKRKYFFSTVVKPVI